MNKWIARALWALATGIGCCSFCRVQAVEAQGPDALLMVVNPDNTSAAKMNIGDARKLLLGETQTWHNGTKVLVVLAPPGTADRAAVLKKVCGMSEAIYTRYQIQAAFNGQSAASIRPAPTDKAVKNEVKANTGAVGFIHKGGVDPTVQAVLELP